MQSSDPRLNGKTPEEILGIASALLTVAEKFNQPIAAPPAAAPNRFDLDLPDEDYLTGRQVKQVMQQFANQPAPVDHVARRQNILLSIAQLKQDPRYKSAFERWGTEIYGEWNKLHPDYVGLDTLETCVKMVLGNHIDELAAEKAQRLVNESHPTIRSGTGGSGSVPNTQQSVLDNAPSDLQARLRAVGIQSEADLRRACEGTGITPDAYLVELEKFGKGAVIRG